MDDEDWSALARFLRDQIREAGLDDIADFDSYAHWEGGRRFPSGRDIVKAMLAALQRHVVMNSEDTLELSLETLRGSIDEGRRLEHAMVHFDNERGPLEGRASVPVARLGPKEEILVAIRELQTRLFEDTPEPDGDPDGP